MSVPKEKDVARRLASLEAPEPPADLLEKIQAEIPAHLEPVPVEEPPRPFPERSRLWLIAASLVVAVGAGFLALEVLRQVAPSGLPETVTTPGLVGGALQEEPAGAGPDEGEPEAEPSLAGKPAGKEAPLRQDARDPIPRDPALQSSFEDLAATEGVDDLGATVPEEPRWAREDQRLADPAPAVPPPPPPPPSTARTVTDSSAVGSYDLEAEASRETVEDEISVVGEAPEPLVSTQIGRNMEPSRKQRKRERRREGTARRLASPELPKPTAAYPPPSAAPPSTGGTAEPNDQPYGDVFFRHEGTNPFIDTEEDRLSTFGLDVDTGSYTVARRYLRDGHLPPADSVRVEEWINAFDYGDDPPARGDFALHGEGSPTPFAGDRYRLLRFAIKGRTVDVADRKPAVLTFVVDVSGSMNRENRLGLVQESLKLLLAELKGGDRVGLVIFGSRGEVLLEPSPDLRRIRAAIERLVPGGSTNAEEGLALGYDLASRYFRHGAINRVILCSDGVANVGRTGPESILERVRREAEGGIELTTLGFGMGNYNDVLMEQLADQGDGRYAYLDTLEEARRVLVEDLTGTLQTIASEARAQVEFNPEVVERYRLLGYENRDIADHRFRDDTVDAGEIGAGHAVTALYEVKLRPRSRRGGELRRGDRLATLRLRYRSAASGEFEEVAREIRGADLAPSWRRASASLRLASLVAEMAEILKKSYWAKGGSLERVFRLAQELSPEFPGDERVAELVALAGKAARLHRTGGG